MSENEGLIHDLRRFAFAYNRQVAAFGRANGLHSTDIRALVALLDAERAGTIATPSRLAGELELTPASATALTDRLVEAGHVERVPDAIDRRRVRLRVTASARAIGEEFFGPIFERIGTSAHRLSPNQIRAFRTFLAGVNETD